MRRDLAYYAVTKHDGLHIVGPNAVYVVPVTGNVKLGMRFELNTYIEFLNAALVFEDKLWLYDKSRELGPFVGKPSDQEAYADTMSAEYSEVNKGFFKRVLLAAKPTGILVLLPGGGMMATDYHTMHVAFSGVHKLDFSEDVPLNVVRELHHGVRYAAKNEKSRDFPVIFDLFTEAVLPQRAKAPAWRELLERDGTKIELPELKLGRSNRKNIVRFGDGKITVSGDHGEREVGTWDGPEFAVMQRYLSNALKFIGKPEEVVLVPRKGTLHRERRWAFLKIKKGDRVAVIATWG